MKTRTIITSKLFMIAGLFYSHCAMSGINASSAQALAKDEGCLKCHGVDKAKEGKSLKEIAQKYKGKPDANATILKQITTGVTIKLKEGGEDEHKIIKTKDKAAIDNLIAWILSLSK